MTDAELEEFLSGLEQNPNQYIEMVGEPDEISLSDVSDQLEVSNWIGAGMIFFMGVLAGLMFIKILLERLK